MIFFFNLVPHYFILFIFIKFNPYSFDCYFFVILDLFYFSISSLIILFHLILISNLILIILIAIFFNFFLDLFYFLISSLAIFFHLVCIPNLVLIILIIFFLILDDYEFYFVIFHDQGHGFWRLSQINFSLVLCFFF